MSKSSTDPKSVWTERWLESVKDGTSTMSQRKLSSIETRGLGLATTKKLAEEKGVHLLLLNDDQGDDLVAASKKPFKVVC